MRKMEVCMKKSVALAYYNGGKYIDEQLGSILPQLDPEDEVILSVDAAEDGSEEILKKWSKADRRVRVIRGPGQGVTANFGHAIKACRGDVIFLSDQDDIWEEGKVAAVMKAMETTGCLCVLHNAIQVNSLGEREDLQDLFTVRGSRTGLVKNFMKNSYVGCCMAFRRELIPIILPIPRRMYMHDYWIGTAAEICGRVILLDEPLLLYRRHEDNVTQMHHGSLGFMIKKRLGILSCLPVLILRRRSLWK